MQCCQDQEYAFRLNGCFLQTVLKNRISWDCAHQQPPFLPSSGVLSLTLKTVSEATHYPDPATLGIHHVSAQQMTRNTTRFNVWQNRSLFQLGNTGSKQVSIYIYMGTISAPKIVSGLQKRIVLPGEVAMVIILSLDSNSAFVTSYSPNTASHTSLLIFTHTPTSSPPFLKSPLQQTWRTLSPKWHSWKPLHG